MELVAHAKDTNASLLFCQQHLAEIMILEVRPGDQGLLAKVPRRTAPQRGNGVLDSDRQRVQRRRSDAAGERKTRESRSICPAHPAPHP